MEEPAAPWRGTAHSRTNQRKDPATDESCHHCPTRRPETWPVAPSGLGETMPLEVVSDISGGVVTVSTSVSGTGTGSLRVAVVDDSTLFRQGLIGLLAVAGVDAAVEARSGDELRARLRTTSVDVAILDLRMPPTFTDEGVELALRLRRDDPSVGVLVLSTYAEVNYAVRLLADGGSGVGYLLKDRVDTVGALVDAVDRVHRKETVIDPALVVRLVNHQRVADILGRLSPRERDVLEQMAEGRSNQGIAAQLHVSVKTVERHIADIFQHLDLPANLSANRRVLAVLSWLRLTHS